eukprot:Tbor_TRINITY_DN3198_c0_g1::TRINITY_DN3198_c0_g1_i1::g.14656::m.14656
MGCSSPQNTDIHFSDSMILKMTPTCISIDEFDLKHRSTDDSDHYDCRLVERCVIGASSNDLSVKDDLNWYISSIMEFASASLIYPSDESNKFIVTGEKLRSAMENDEMPKYIAARSRKSYRMYNIVRSSYSDGTDAACAIGTGGAKYFPVYKRINKTQEKHVSAMAFEIVSCVMSNVLGEDAAQAGLYNNIK